MRGIQVRVEGFLIGIDLVQKNAARIVAIVQYVIPLTPGLVGHGHLRGFRRQGLKLCEPFGFDPEFDENGIVQQRVIHSQDTPEDEQMVLPWHCFRELVPDQCPSAYVVMEPELNNENDTKRFIGCCMMPERKGAGKEPICFTCCAAQPAS